MADTTAPVTADPLVSACVRVGWQMEELFSRLSVPGGPQPAYGLDRLAGFSKLNSYDKQRLGLKEVDFVLDQVAAKIQAPQAAVASLSESARAALEATVESSDSAAERRTAYRQALADLHATLLTTLTAAGSSYGKAYGLGRALADTTRPDQAPGDLTKSFQRYRVGELYTWLDDLASLLPANSARAVALSLTWWQQGVAAATAGSKLSAAERPASYPASPAVPRWKRATAVLMPGSKAARPGDAEPPPIAELATAVGRQGNLWLQVLDGEKQCIDMLNSQDYIRAGERLARRWAGLALRMVRTMPWLLILLALLLAGVILALVFIPGSAVARTATGTAAVAGTLSAIWKLIQSRLGNIAAQVEQPLWGAELNTAAAEAITVPPLSSPQDPVLEASEHAVAAGAAADPG